jgi:hypothetical protein
VSSPINSDAVRPDRSLLPRGLAKLIVLRYKAFLRRTIFGSGKRRLFTLVGFGLIAVWMAPRFFTTRTTSFSADDLRLWLPAFLGLIILLQLLIRERRDSSIFQAAELDMVVPGPFSRHQLLVYQMIYQVGPLLVMGLWMAFFFQHGGSYLAAAIGIALIGQLLNLITAVIGSLGGLLNVRARWVGASISLIVAAVITWAVMTGPTAPVGGDLTQWITWIRALRHTPAVEFLCAPFFPYIEVMVSSSNAQAWPWIALVILINLALAVIFLALDRSELEAMVAQSQKRLDLVHRALRGGAGLGDLQKSARRTIAMPPRLGGAGPIFWRQLTMFNRGVGWMAAIIMASVLVGAYFLGRLTQSGSAVMLVVVNLQLAFFLSMFLRRDFRSDLDHMPTLKTLPLQSRTIVIGQLATPILIITGLQIAVMCGVLLGAAGGTNFQFALLVCLGSMIFSAILVAMDNMVFLIAPTRMLQSSMQGGFDPAQMGRHMLVILFKAVAIALIAAVIGGPVALLVWMDMPTLVIGAVAGLLALCVVWSLVELCGWAFRAFNVVDDQPL